MGIISNLVSIFLCLEGLSMCCHALSEDAQSTSTSSFSFIGVYSNNYAVIMDKKKSDHQDGSKVTLQYWWKEENNRTSKKYFQNFKAGKAITLIKLQNITNSPTLCVAFENDDLENCCKNIKEINFLDLLKPTDVHISSINYNYSLLWKYKLPFLLNDVFFKVHLENDLWDEWEIAKDCDRVFNYHCDLFLNHFERDDPSCPDLNVVLYVKAKVQVCLSSYPDVCGENVTNPKFDLELDGKITPPSFRILPRIVNKHLKIENQPHTVVFSNKSLKCYFADDLKYSIRYYNEDVKGMIVQDKNDVDFDMKSIALPLNRTIRNNSKMCVKMKIVGDVEDVSEWEEQCVRVLSDSEDNKLVFWLPLISSIFSALLFLIYIGCKIRRYYKSFDFEIPEELEEIKMEMESKDFGLYVDHFFVQRKSFSDDKFGSVDVADPLTLQDKKNAKFPLISDSKLQLKFNCSVEEGDSKAPTVFSPEASNFGDWFNSSLCGTRIESSSTSYVYQIESGELVDVSQYQQASPILSTFPVSPDVKDQYFCDNGKIENSQDDCDVTSVAESVGSNYMHDISKNKQLTLHSTQPKAAQYAMPEAFESRYDSVFSVDESSGDTSGNAERQKPQRHGVIKLANPTYALYTSSEVKNFDCSCPQSLTTHLATCKLSDCVHVKLVQGSTKRCETKESTSTGAVDGNEEPKRKISLLQLTKTQPSSSKFQDVSCLEKDDVINRDPNMSREAFCKRKEKTHTSSTKLPASVKFDSSRTTSVFMSGGRYSHDAPDDYVAPYIVYTRSRHDSYRSADSGFPHDYPSFSDDSASPPQSPDEFCFGQGLSLSQHRSGFNRFARQDDDLKYRTSKDVINGHSRFKYGPRLSLLEITEDMNVQCTGEKENESSASKFIGDKTDCDELSYVQISTLTQQQTTPL